MKKVGVGVGRKGRREERRKEGRKETDSGLACSASLFCFTTFHQHLALSRSRSILILSSTLLPVLPNSVSSANMVNTPSKSLSKVLTKLLNRTGSIREHGATLLRGPRSRLSESYRTILRVWGVQRTQG